MQLQVRTKHQAGKIVACAEELVKHSSYKAELLLQVSNSNAPWDMSARLHVTQTNDVNQIRDCVSGAT